MAHLPQSLQYRERKLGKSRRVPALVRFPVYQHGHLVQYAIQLRSPSPGTRATTGPHDALQYQEAPPCSNCFSRLGRRQKLALGLELNFNVLLPAIAGIVFASSSISFAIPPSTRHHPRRPCPKLREKALVLPSDTCETRDPWSSTFPAAPL